MTPETNAMNLSLVESLKIFIRNKVPLNQLSEPIMTDLRDHTNSSVDIVRAWFLLEVLNITNHQHRLSLDQLTQARRTIVNRLAHHRLSTSDRHLAHSSS